MRSTEGMDDAAQRFRTWLKDRLAQPGRSQSALARHMGLDSSAINRLVNGKRELKAREVEQIWQYLSRTAASVEAAAEEQFIREEYGIGRRELAAAGDPKSQALLSDALASKKALFLSMGRIVDRALTAALRRESDLVGRDRFIELVRETALKEERPDYIAVGVLRSAGALSPAEAEDVADVLRLEALAKRAAGEEFPTPEAEAIYRGLIERHAVPGSSLEDRAEVDMFYTILCNVIAMHLRTGSRDAVADWLKGALDTIHSR